MIRCPDKIADKELGPRRKQPIEEDLLQIDPTLHKPAPKIKRQVLTRNRSTDSIPSLSASSLALLGMSSPQQGQVSFDYVNEIADVLFSGLYVLSWTDCYIWETGSRTDD
ncbi:cytochrome b5 reductase 4-like X4 [Biomphalaria glabrata]